MMSSRLFMGAFSCVLMIMMGPAGGLAAETCTEPPKLPETLLVVPYHSTQTYPDPKYGVTLRYLGNARSISVTTYDAGLDKTDFDSLVTQYQNAADEIRIFAERKNHKVLEINQLDPLKFDQATYYPIQFHIQREGQVNKDFDYVSLSHDGRCFLKIRYTDFGSVEADKTRSQFAAIVYIIHQALTK